MPDEITLGDLIRDETNMDGDGVIDTDAEFCAIFSEDYANELKKNR